MASFGCPVLQMTEVITMSETIGTAKDIPKTGAKTNKVQKGKSEMGFAYKIAWYFYYVIVFHNYVNKGFYFES